MAEHGRGDDTSCRVILLGVLTEMPCLLAPGKNGQRVEAVVKAAGQEIPVQASGDIAERLAGLKKGTRVRINGPLRRYTWKTRGEYKARERLVVVCDELQHYR